MEQTFLTGIEIEKVRHLKGISIPLDRERRKHLILTGKNGSGKTSVLETMVKAFGLIISKPPVPEKSVRKHCADYVQEVEQLNLILQKDDSEERRRQQNQAEMRLKYWKYELENMMTGISLHWTSKALLEQKYEKGEFIFAYYKAEREFQAEEYSNIEKVKFQNKYGIAENPGKKLTKYLVDLKATQAFSKDTQKIEKIDKWFCNFESVLKTIFDDSGLTLVFHDDTFQFSIHESGREPFDFNTMSSGYAAVFDIINDLIMRMEAQSGLRTEFDMEGVVLVDEIETHLHLELQKKILPVLTTLFPNIQFVITTHSPFILSSLDHAVIYDLENKTLVENGLNHLPYEGIVEGYFRADKLSEELREKFERYKVLVSKEELSDEEYEEIDKLEFYLDEIPDYLAKELTAEYSRLKLEFSNRG